MDATYAPAMDPVYHTTAHSVSGPEQFSLQPSASQGMLLTELDSFFIKAKMTFNNPGHIAGGFARHRYDLKSQMQQQTPSATLAPQSLATDNSAAAVGRGEVTSGVVQQMVNQIQQQPQTSASSQRGSTSLSAAR